MPNCCAVRHAASSSRKAGNTHCECGKRILGDLSAARASMDSLGQTLSGRVRVSVPTCFGRCLSNRSCWISRAHPGITLDFTFNNRIEDLIASQVDVALEITRTPPLDCVARSIRLIDWRLYASQEYVKAHGPVVTPADLDRQTVARVIRQSRAISRLNGSSTARSTSRITLDRCRICPTSVSPVLRCGFCSRWGVSERVDVSQLCPKTACA